MTEKFEFYKCNICGNTVQVLFSGVGELVCCGENMHNLNVQNVDNNELAEKHVPEIDEGDNFKLVRLSHHPMLPEHYIQFIQVISKDEKCMHTKFLSPNEIAEFDVSFMDRDFVAVELCNVHGLWRNVNDK